MNFTFQCFKDTGTTLTFCFCTKNPADNIVTEIKGKIIEMWSGVDYEYDDDHPHSVVEIFISQGAHSV